MVLQAAEAYSPQPVATALEDAAFIWATLSLAERLPGTPDELDEIRTMWNAFTHRLTTAGLDLDAVRAEAARQGREIARAATHRAPPPGA